MSVQGDICYGFLKVKKPLTRKPRRKRNARNFLVFREIRPLRVIRVKTAPQTHKSANLLLESRMIFVVAQAKAKVGNL